MFDWVLVVYWSSRSTCTVRELPGFAVLSDRALTITNQQLLASPEGMPMWHLSWIWPASQVPRSPNPVCLKGLLLYFFHSIA